MAVPPARYIAVDHDGTWKINLNNKYFGPFADKQACVDAAIKGAKEAAAKGYPAAALLLVEEGKFEKLWVAENTPG